MSTFLLELRDTAKLLPNPSDAQTLKDIADRIAFAIDALHDMPTTENVAILNGMWAIGARALRIAKVPMDDGPSGGALDGVELQRAA